MNPRAPIIILSLTLIFTACGKRDPQSTQIDTKPPTSTKPTTHTTNDPNPDNTDRPRNRPGEPNFDPTKQVWPPLNPPVPDKPITITARIDRATQHGLHTTLAISFHGDLENLGDFSFRLLIDDANARTLSMQRVMVPSGARTREVTLMGVDASKIRSFQIDLLDAQTADAHYLGDLPKRYKLTIQDAR